MTMILILHLFTSSSPFRHSYPHFPSLHHPEFLRSVSPTKMIIDDSYSANGRRRCISRILIPSLHSTTTAYSDFFYFLAWGSRERKPGLIWTALTRIMVGSLAVASYTSCSHASSCYLNSDHHHHRHHRCISEGKMNKMWANIINFIGPALPPQPTTTVPLARCTSLNCTALHCTAPPPPLVSSLFLWVFSSF